MRGNQNLSGSSSGRVERKLSLPAMPLEWLDAGSWRLPSGQALAEFALQAGFLVPLLLRSGRFDEAGAGSAAERLLAGAGARTEGFGKGGTR